jgi:hypothetical protein
MKVLRVVGLILGIMLILGGAALMVASFALEKTQGVVERQLQSGGLQGPVQGTVTAINDRFVTVRFTDTQGEDHTATAAEATTRPPKVGDLVAVLYDPDDPSLVVIADLPMTPLSTAGSRLKTIGIVSLVCGGLILTASIVGFVLARRTPQQQRQPFPSAGYGPPPGTGFPVQPGSQYPPAGQYPPAQYPPAQYPPGGQYPATQYPPAGQDPINPYSPGQYPPNQYQPAPYPASQNPASQNPASQNLPGQNPFGPES